jgi:serine/threonine-protein kinase HipA
LKLPAGSPLTVRLALAPGRSLPVGRLVLDTRGAALAYAPEFIASGLTLNPFFEPPREGALVWAASPRDFDGLHGVFADSLPDSWGEMLVRRRVEANGIGFASLTSLDKLAIVGSRGPGALVYEPAIPNGDIAEIDLDSLADEALALLEGRDSFSVADLERLGGSSGGARPKLLIAIDAHGTMLPGDGDVPVGFVPWIVKFRSSRREYPDCGPLELAYSIMAREAGLEMAQTVVLPATTGPGYFATKRFDRAPGGGRIHMASVAGLLDCRWDVPEIDANDLLKTVRKITGEHAAVEMMFRRIGFNVVAHNRDDHAKQHAFLLGEDGAWVLAPAYDLTFSGGSGAQHYLAVKGRGGDDITLAHLRSLGHDHGLSAAHITDVIEQVTTAVSRFDASAIDCDVSSKTRREVTRELEAGLARFA